MPTTVGQNEHDQGETIRVGTFAVTTDADDVSAFAQALDLQVSRSPNLELVPFSFPIRWLALPNVREAIRRLLPDELNDQLIVHESQWFEYVTRLKQNRSYELTLTAQFTPPTPRRIILYAAVNDDLGNSALHLRSVLRLIASNSTDAP